MVEVGLGQALRGGGDVAVQHLVLQFHQMAHDAAYAPVQQVVVGVRGLYAPVGEVGRRHVDVCVYHSAASLLVEFHHHLSASQPVGISVAAEAYVVVYGCNHGVGYLV